MRIHLVVIEQIGEICKNGTANIGLCSFVIGPTFHRHKWSHHVIHWEWQFHEWSVFAVLILQFFLEMAPCDKLRQTMLFRSRLPVQISMCICIATRAVQSGCLFYYCIVMQCFVFTSMLESSPLRVTTLTFFSTIHVYSLWGSSVILILFVY